NAVWSIPRRNRPNFWLRLVRSLASLVVVAAAVLVAAALTQLGALPFIGSLLLNLLLLILLFQVLTGRRVAWRQLLPGAAAAAAGWSILQTLGVYILDRQLAQANLIYGVFAVVIVLLSWLYLSAQLLLYAAELNAVLARRLWPRGLIQPPLTEPDRRVLAALAEAEARRPEETIEVRFTPEEDDRQP
ncbi:MAG TPA: YhjD/YihY/BrkB family envelope integrity protein, partial [Actinomycetes bacterium]|nr:YhjD/YihY/BrkB family envelope integrity protein [Actinomycetes bacterium]